MFRSCVSFIRSHSINHNHTQDILDMTYICVLVSGESTEAELTSQLLDGSRAPMQELSTSDNVSFLRGRPLKNKIIFLHSLQFAPKRYQAEPKGCMADIS